MTHSGKTQKGFALFEGLLIIIIIAVIGGIGWYAIHTKHQTDKILSQADKISQTTPLKKSNAIPSTQMASQKTLIISEWGVEAKYTSSVDLIYKLTSDNQGEVWAQMSSKQMVDADPANCGIETQLGGIISRLHSGDHLLNPAGDDTGQTIEDAVKTGVLGEYSHVGDYYYFYVHPQAGCGVSKTMSDLQDVTLAAVREAAKSFQQIR